MGDIYANCLDLDGDYFDYDEDGYFEDGCCDNYDETS